MIPSHLIPSLTGAANGAIGNVLRFGGRGQSMPTGEVGFVAAVVLGGVRDLAAAWQPILRPHGYSVRVSGVFCHQSPKATFIDSHGSKVTCELADLLVVVDDFTGGQLGRRWAALIQAKMAAKGGGQTLANPHDLRQLYLMSRWPSFTLPSKYGPGPRDFSTCSHPGSVFDCGRYGLIAPQPVPNWHQQAPAATMPAGGDQLGTFLARMVETGQTQYGREATGVSDDWSRTVEELMTRTYAKLFKYAGGFSGRQKRGHSAVAMIAPHWFAEDSFSYPFEFDGSPPAGGGPDDSADEDPDPGVSVLRIAIGRREEAEPYR